MFVEKSFVLGEVKLIKDKMLNLKVRKGGDTFWVEGRVDLVDEDGIRLDMSYRYTSRQYFFKYGDILEAKEHSNKTDKLKEIIKPLEDYVNNELCPHDKIIITQGHVEVVNGDFAFPLEIKD